MNIGVVGLRTETEVDIRRPISINLKKRRLQSDRTKLNKTEENENEINLNESRSAR